jgi:hypothetical protein
MPCLYVWQPCPAREALIKADETADYTDKKDGTDE